MSQWTGRRHCKKISELIDKFYGRQKFYESAEYNETQCRQDFINPLFAALGWDIENTENLGTYYESILDRDFRKEGGIYYTPSYIVDYIVENTVGKFLENKTPTEAANIRPEPGQAVGARPARTFDLVQTPSVVGLDESSSGISNRLQYTVVDSACGAGVFLVSVYQYLLDWHERRTGKLMLAKRRKIPSNNIFGVDINPLAVEIPFSYLTFIFLSVQ